MGLLALAACSTPVDDQTPLASSGPSASTSNWLSAPRVPKPLDVSKFDQEPCKLLSQAQASQVANLTASTKSAGNVAPICSWADSDHNTIAFGFVPGNGGLTTVYKNQTNKSGYFEVAPEIVGYPAAFFSPLDNRHDGSCQVGVGVTNDNVITVSADFRNSSPHYSDPCSVTVKAAEAAMTTLKGGA
jgi:hypothetical protein